MEEPIPSYKDWRVGLPPQWYPTHSNAYYVGVTGGSFTEAREPLVNIAWALNLTVAGIVARQSALKGGELMKIPQFS